MAEVRGRPSAPIPSAGPEKGKKVCISCKRELEISQFKFFPLRKTYSEWCSNCQEKEIENIKLRREELKKKGNGDRPKLCKDKDKPEIRILLKEDQNQNQIQNQFSDPRAGLQPGSIEMRIADLEIQVKKLELALEREVYKREFKTEGLERVQIKQGTSLANLWTAFSAQDKRRAVTAKRLDLIVSEIRISDQNYLLGSQIRQILINMEGSFSYRQLSDLYRHMKKDPRLILRESRVRRRGRRTYYVFLDQAAQEGAGSEEGTDGEKAGGD